jgi:hypothetical protein
MNELLLAEAAYDPQCAEWMEKAEIVVTAASSEELEFLISGLSKAQIGDLVKHSPHLQKHVFRGFRPGRLPKDAHKRLARDAKGDKGACTILLCEWMICYGSLVETFAQISVDDPRRAIVWLAALSGERDRHALLWVLKLDPRPDVGRALASGLARELEEPSSGIRLAIDITPSLTELVQSIHEQAAGEENELLNKENIVEQAHRLDEETRRRPTSRLLAAVGHFFGDKEQASAENEVASVQIDLAKSADVASASLVAHNELASGQESAYVPVSKEEIEAMLGNIEQITQKRLRARHTLIKRVTNLAQAISSDEADIRELDSALTEVSDNWSDLAHQLTVDADELHRVATEAASFLDQQDEIPELKEIAITLRQLSLDPLARLVDVQECSEILQREWQKALSIISDYHALQEDLAQIIQSVSATWHLLQSSFGHVIGFQPEVEALDDWEARVSEWKPLKARASELQESLSRELEQREQSVRDEIRTMQIELHRPSRHPQQLSVEQDMALLDVDPEEMGLADLLTLRSRIEQLYQQVEALDVPTEPETVITMLRQIVEESRPTGPLATHSAAFLGRLLLTAAQQDTVSPTLLWEACAAVHTALGGGAKQAQFYETYGYSIVAAAYETHLPHRRLVELLGFVRNGFLPEAGAQTVWRRPEVSQVVHEYGVNHIAASLAEVSLDALAPEDLHTLAALAEVGEQDPTVQLSLSAALLTFAEPSSWEYSVGANALIRALNRTARYGSAFFAWQALNQHRAGMLSEDIALSLFQGLFDRLWDISDRERLRLLDEVCDKLAWHAKGVGIDNLYLTVGAASCLACIHLPDSICTNHAWQFISEIRESYPFLANWMTHQLGGEAIATMAHPGLVEDKERQLKSALQDLEHELREHGLRGVPLAKRLDRDNLTAVFIPLANEVRGHKIPSDILARIDALDPEAMITQHPLQREASKRDRVHHPLLGDIIRYNQSRIDCLRRVAELRLQLAELSDSVSEYEDEFEAAQKESQHLLERIPASVSVLRKVYEAIGLAPG